MLPCQLCESQATRLIYLPLDENMGSPHLASFLLQLPAISFCLWQSVSVSHSHRFPSTSFKNSFVKALGFQHIHRYVQPSILEHFILCATGQFQKHFHHFKRKSHRLCNWASCLVELKHSLYILDTGLLPGVCHFLSAEILHVIFPTFFNGHCLLSRDEPTRCTGSQGERTLCKSVKYQCFHWHSGAGYAHLCPLVDPMAIKPELVFFKNYLVAEAACWAVD